MKPRFSKQAADFLRCRTSFLCWSCCRGHKKTTLAWLHIGAILAAEVFTFEQTFPSSWAFGNGNTGNMVLLLLLISFPAWMNFLHRNAEKEEQQWQCVAEGGMEGEPDAPASPAWSSPAWEAWQKGKPFSWLPHHWPPGLWVPGLKEGHARADLFPSLCVVPFRLQRLVLPIPTRENSSLSVLLAAHVLALQQLHLDVHKFLCFLNT